MGNCYVNRDLGERIKKRGCELYINRIAITVTTNADGDAVAYSSEPINGEIVEIRYVKTDFADGSTITITGAVTGTPILAETAINASTTRAPRQATHGVTGTAQTYDGTYPALDRIAIASERLKIVVSGGGNVKTGVFHVTVS